MNSIGGYFELELNSGNHYHNEAIRLNTGRNAFEYILRTKAYKKVYLPYYTCEAMLEPITKLGLEYEFYKITLDFRPIFNFDKIKNNEVFVYTNYYGLCSSVTKDLTRKTKNIIVDNSQAFFDKPLPEVDTFYSARKFFGVPDGAYLYTNQSLDIELEQDISYDRFEHLLGRIDLGPEKFYNQFLKNEKILKKQPIKTMSSLTENILKSIDYKNARKIRLANFKVLANTLSSRNQIKLNLDLTEVPMIYPYLVNSGYRIKKKLIEKRIYTATYWSNIDYWMKHEDTTEKHLLRNLVVLPLDQRYTTKDLLKITNILNLLQ